MVAVALTAGICEEFVFRGVLIHWLHFTFPALPVVALVAVAAAVFGAAHAYQGWGGMLSTGLFGALLAVVYTATGSLLLPAVLHALVDLRTIWLPTAAHQDLKE